MDRKPKVGIIGCGLIGGSVALAATRAGYPVIGTDIDASIREEFIRRTGGGWAQDVGPLIRWCDILIIAVPADAVATVVEQSLPHLTPGQIITDVSSTKTSPMIVLKTAPTGVHVVGSHPMAGKASGGFAAADGHLFDGCTWVMCPADGESVPGPLSRLILEAGASQIVVCSPEEHDRAVAAISHGVQVGATSLAAAVSTIIGSSQLPWRLAAGGWRDSTRVAESDPDIWAPLLAENREHVMPVLIELETRIRAMREALAAGDDATVRDLIADGQQARADWQATTDPEQVRPA